MGMHSPETAHWWLSPPLPSPKHLLERHLSPTLGKCSYQPRAPSDHQTEGQTGGCTSPSTASGKDSRIRTVTFLWVIITLNQMNTCLVTSPCRDVSWWWDWGGDFEKRTSHFWDHPRGLSHRGSDLIDKEVVRKWQEKNHTRFSTSQISHFIQTLPQPCAIKQCCSKWGRWPLEGQQGALGWPPKIWGKILRNCYKEANFKKM